MNNILENLFYKEILVIGNKTTLLKMLDRETSRDKSKRYTRIFKKSGSKQNQHHSK